MQLMRNFIWLAISSLCLLATSIFSLIVSDIDLSAIANKITQPIATLAGGIIGLGAIAYQTNKGFRNLIRSQEHKAEIERDGRLHVHELAVKERTELDKIKEIRVISAIRGELVGLNFRYKELSRSLARSADNQRTRQERDFSFRKQSLKVDRLETPIIDSCISQLNFIDARILTDISLLYSKILYGINFVDMDDYDIYLKVYDTYSSVYLKMSNECAQLVGIINCYINEKKYCGPITSEYDFDRITDE